MRRVPVLLAGAVLLSACRQQPEVSTEELESQVSGQLQQEVGRAPERVACEEALLAEVGASARCELTAADGTRFGLTVETTEVDGEIVRFSIAVDEEPVG